MKSLLLFGYLGFWFGSPDCCEDPPAYVACPVCVQQPGYVTEPVVICYRPRILEKLFSCFQRLGCGAPSTTVVKEQAVPTPGIVAPVTPENGEPPVPPEPTKE